MLDYLNAIYPVRYTVFGLSSFGLLLTIFSLVAFGQGVEMLLMFLLLVGIGVFDLLQSRRALLRNYPIIGHLHLLLVYLQPAIRPDVGDSGMRSAPFSRAQRALVVQRANGASELRPFGTALAVQAQGYEWLNHSAVPTRLDSHDFRLTIGADRAQPYSASVFNISALSFGALSANAILALNAGARRGGFAHDSGEGSISSHHRVHGGDLIWEIGTGYFGCRNGDGTFNADQFSNHARDPQVKMIELKLSQGAQPGCASVLPAIKVTPEIAAARGVPAGLDCVSPAVHSAFTTPLGLLQFVARLRTIAEGKPTGIKLCIGHPWEWFALVKAMLASGITPDFIVLDGADGGTGAAPREFSDHVGAPLEEGLLLVHNTLRGAGLRDQIKLGCAGKVTSAFDIARLIALGADWCNSARGFMFALGCIQSQHCHTNQCPTGVATQDPLRQRSLVAPDKAQRVYNFHQQTLRALRELVQAAGLTHPGELTAHHVMCRTATHQLKSLAQLTATPLAMGALLQDDLSGLAPVYQQHWAQARADSFMLQN